MRSLRSFLSSSVEFCPAPRDLPAATGQPGLRPRLHASRTLCTAKINNSGQSSTPPILHHRIPERIHGAPPSPTDLRWSPRAQPRTCFSPSPLRSGGLQPGERAAGERSSFFSLGGRTFRSDIKPPNTPCHSERSGPAFSSARFLRSAHLLLHRYRVLFSIRFHRKKSCIARSVRRKRIRKDAPILRRRPKTPSLLHTNRLHGTSSRPALGASQPPRQPQTLHRQLQ